jgi:hypothetical protein
MDEVIELVVVIPTSPRSSKTESECKSYHRFRVDDSSMPDYPPHFLPDNPSPPQNSGGSLPEMGADFCPDNPGADILPLFDPDNPPLGLRRLPFWRGGYKYPFFLLGLGSKRVYLTSIVDFESLPSFLHSSHNSCIFFREKREEI